VVPDPVVLFCRQFIE